MSDDIFVGDTGPMSPAKNLTEQIIRVVFAWLLCAAVFGLIWWFK